MRFKSFLFVGVLLGLLFSFSVAFAMVGLPERPDRHVPGEIIIGFHPTANYLQMEYAVSSIGGKVIGKHNASQLRARRVKLPSTDPSAIDEAIQNLKSNSAFAGKIKYVEPNMVRKIHGSRSPRGDVGINAQSGDPLLYSQWGYYDIGANWLNAPTSTTGVLVAVIDTGVDYTHPDLLGKVTKGYDFVNMDTDPMDDMGHGTHVSGVIAAKANNGFGMAGISWNAKILAIKALSSSGYGTTWEIYQAIYAAANNSAVKVINMSLGGGYSSFEEEAVRYAVLTKGKLLVASAGNENTNVPSYPAGFADPVAYPGLADGVIAVAAHDTDHCRASFSNYGTWVSISAPGVDIYSSLPFSLGSYGFAAWSGTSMAAPHVSGAAALAWALDPAAAYWQIRTHVVYHNSSPLDFLNRSGGCWPSDGSTFERLDVLHLLEWQYYEQCDNKGAIFGYAFDAETGNPLVGAKVSAKQGTTVRGIDYVPYFGELTYFVDDSVYGSFYGLFNVLVPTPDNTPTDYTLTIAKTKYMTITPKDQGGVPELITVDPCFWSYAGNIPVPPSKPLYWLVVTWDPGFTDTDFDAALEVWYDGEWWDTYYSENPGALNLFPYVRHFWDSYWWGLGDLRDYSESIRILKTSSYTSYFYYVEDWVGDGSSWNTSGIKAYVFKGTTLIKTYTPPPGSSGNVWLICDIAGTTITDYNEVVDF